MTACPYPHLVEFAARRIWCESPWVDAEIVATKLWMTEDALRSTLFYIDDLSHDSIVAYGKERLRDTNSTNARMIGFLRDGHWREF